MQDILNDINDMIDNAGHDLPVVVNISDKKINEFPISELYSYLKDLWESEECPDRQFILADILRSAS